MTARSQDAASYHQNFAYNAFGDLTRVTDSASNTLQTIGYNVRGMKTSMTDMDAGSWTYKPNTLGEVEFVRDAKTTAPAWTTEMTFDPLGRMTQRKDVPENVTSQFTFGSAAPNIGRLMSVAGGGHTENFEYYPLTGQLKRRTIVSDATYVIDYSYNALGLLDVLQYPTSTSSYRFAVKHQYTNGLLTSVSDNQTPGTVFWRASASDAFGNVTSEQLGNGLQTTRGFDAVTGLINSIQTVLSPGAPVQNLTYAWDKVGNLKQRKDVQQNLAEEFYYDSVNRLDCSTLNVAPQTSCAALTAAQMNLNVDYNQLGNITSKTGLGTYTYHATKKHQVTSTSAGGHTYGYDANGNMNSRDGFGITWYSYNLPNTINGAGSSSSQFFYTAERDRWKQVASYGGTAETTIYIGGLVEKVTLGTSVSWRHYIAGGSGPLAVYTRKSTGTNELHYLTRDHLGSIDSITNSAGAVETLLSYGAFGERRNATGWTGNPTASNWTEITDVTRRGFTAHEMLDNLNLIHMNGRVYDQTLGRFLSADPFVPDPGFTQSFNRYSYVYNNPLRYTDPSGFQPSPDSPSPNWCNANCLTFNFSFMFGWGWGGEWFGATRGGIQRPVIPLRDGASHIPVTLERDMAGGEVRKGSTVCRQSCHSGGFFIPEATPEVRAASKRFYQNLSEDFFIPGAGLYHLATGEYYFSGDEGSRISGALGAIPYVGVILRQVGRGIVITAKGLSRIERHLSSLDALEDPANQAMLKRLREGELTQHDINFYLHELKESALMRGDPARYDAAHKGALEWQGIPYNAATPASLYHPDVIREFSEFFNSAAWPQ